MTAREAFCLPTDPSSFGQIDPDRLAHLICDRRLPPGAPSPRTVNEVRVYAGRPSQHRDPKGYAAARRQTARWEANGITVIERTIRYPPNYPSHPPEEKGIDVSLAIDFVAGAVMVPSMSESSSPQTPTWSRPWNWYSHAPASESRRRLPHGTRPAPTDHSAYQERTCGAIDSRRTTTIG